MEQKNWTHVRQWFGYERYDNPAVLEPIRALVRGPYAQLLNYFHASLKLQRKDRDFQGRIKRVYGRAQTPLARVLARPEVDEATKEQLKMQKQSLNPFALHRHVQAELRRIQTIRRSRAD